MTRLTKPVTRVVMVDGQPMNVTLDYAGITFRYFRARTSMTLPYGVGLVRAAMLLGDQKRAARKGGKKGKRVKRSAV